MASFQLLCYLTIFADTALCKQIAMTNTTTVTMSTTQPPNISNPLAPSRLESIKNSYSELELLSKTNPSDFIFDFGTATTGVSNGTGGRTVSATVRISRPRLF
jgi:hypothetical protein